MSCETERGNHKRSVHETTLRETKCSNCCLQQNTSGWCAGFAHYSRCGLRVPLVSLWERERGSVQETTRSCSHNINGSPILTNTDRQSNSKMTPQPSASSCSLLLYLKSFWPMNMSSHPQHSWPSHSFSLSVSQWKKFKTLIQQFWFTTWQVSTIHFYIHYHTISYVIMQDIK